METDSAHHPIRNGRRTARTAVAERQQARTNTARPISSASPA
ncbi:hypothetical protein ABZ848_49345 [Streptomyces sp. NPDC047081]